MELPARKYFMNFCEKVPKKCVLAAYHMRGSFLSPLVQLEKYISSD